MTKFCNCNSSWGAMPHEVRWSDYIIMLDICETCDKYVWYDADYENMMFDLKEMNR